MTAFQAFRRGWSAASRSKVALLLMWFTYALIAKLVAVPALVLLLEPLAHSRMSTQLLSHLRLLLLRLRKHLRLRLILRRRLWLMRLTQ